MQNLNNVKLPSASVISGVVQTALYGSVGVYGLYNGLFNVEGGHRAIVYNRVSGVKQKVRRDRRIGSRGGRAFAPRWTPLSFARHGGVVRGSRAPRDAATGRARRRSRRRRASARPVARDDSEEFIRRRIPRSSGTASVAPPPHARSIAPPRA